MPVARLHAASAGESLPADLCLLRDRYSFLSRRRLRPVVDMHPVPGFPLAAWDRFGDVVPADVAEIVLAFVDEPAPLVDALARRPTTLIHGDLKLSNVGLDSDRVVLVDWGCLTGVAPPACT